MIMRYQGISPESEAVVNNGRRTNSPSNPNWKTYKEEEDWYMKTVSTSTTPFESKGVFSSRFRSPSKTSQDESSPNSPPTATSTASNSATNHEVVVVGGGGGGGNGESTFLQWGHRKRSRRGITMADDTSSSSTSGGLLNHTPVKIQRNSAADNGCNLMPPPSIPASSPNGIGIHQTGLAMKSQARNLVSSPSPLRRNLEERSQSGGGNRAVSGGRSRAVKRTSSPFIDKKSSASSSLLAKDEMKMNGVNNQAVVNSDGNHRFHTPPPQQQQQQQQQQGGCSSSGVVNDESNSVRNGKVVVGIAAAGGGGKVNGGGGEVVQWPRIYIPLSRKEKEEDFLAIKGTKLPYRPKKRPKAVDRIIQYCYPGMWLPDLTKGRYEVREKKSSKKQKRRGLKGMESMESDSE